MKDYCFVAQPFDDERFDARYFETIEPAVEACGLGCYRVDRDRSVVFPVCSMEEKIASASLVIAEITQDNPNVWYEIGYAAAKGKPIIMVCSDERKHQLPFDIRHKSVLYYRTNSRKDFDRYKEDLIDAIKARCQIGAANPQAESLLQEELLLLKFLASDQKTVHAITSEEKIMLQSALDKPTSEYCLRSLTARGYLEYSYSTDGMYVGYYHVTAKTKNLLFG